jgi:hypothetical protein
MDDTIRDGAPGASVLVIFYRNALRLYRETKGEANLEWLNYLVKMNSISMTIYLVGGIFIGVAFQPLLYYIIALGVCLNEYHRRWQWANQVQASPMLRRYDVRPAIVTAARKLGDARIPRLHQG